MSPPTRKNYARPLMYLVIALGSIVWLASVLRFPVEQINFDFLLLTTITIFLSSRVGIEFSQHRVHITVSDTFVFLILLLYGGEAAVIVAAAEAFCSSFRFSKLWVTRLFNAGLLAISTFVTSTVVNTLFGSPVELTKGPITATFVTAICILALTQYATNSGIAALRESLKLGQSLWLIWKENFLWTSVTYFAGASAAGVTAKLVFDSGFYAFVAAIPIIGIIYFTYRAYRRQLEATTSQAEQAIRHAGEQDVISQELRRSEEHFRGAFDYAAIGMALIGPDGRWLRVNQSFCSLVGYSNEELLEMDCQTVTHPDDLDKELANMYRLLEKKAISITLEKRYIHQRGHEVWTINSLSTVADSDGNPMHFIMQAQDITERKYAEENLHRAAFYDSLTSLGNRALLSEHLRLAMNQAKLYEDHLYAVLFLDVDQFKDINDSLGHVIGDQLLIAVARRIEKCVRAGDTVSRFGGDEFAILLNGINSSADAISIAERIQRELALPFELAGHEVYSGGSIGMALSSFEYTQSEEILRDADTAMYHAKEQGKARLEIFDKVMHAKVISRLQIESELRRAVERAEFEVHYQPIIDLRTNAISGFEALLRWRHPTRGMVLPGEFIPVAEASELIVPIGQWVLLEACRQVREWQTKWAFPSPLTISVNLSGQQFKQPDLVEQVQQILYQTNLAPECLNLEITESILMDNATSATAMLRQLRDLGVQISIDDFGTGYSSLSYLHRFPINILKVDRSFVARMATDVESSAIVETIIALAVKLKMKVVAEGVETAEQGEELRKLNCEYAQGYYFSKPVPASEAEELVRNELKKQNVNILPAAALDENSGLASVGYLM